MQSVLTISFLRYINSGLAGKNEFEEARVDEVALGMEDVIQGLFKFFGEKDETRKVR